MKIVFPAVKMFCKGIICFFSHRNGRFCVKIMIFVLPLFNILLFFQFLGIVSSFLSSFFSFWERKARFCLSCTFFTSRKRFSSFVRRIPRVGNVFKRFIPLFCVRKYEGASDFPSFIVVIPLARADCNWCAAKQKGFCTPPKILTKALDGRIAPAQHRRC